METIVFFKNKLYFFSDGNIGKCFIISVEWVSQMTTECMNHKVKNDKFNYINIQEFGVTKYITEKILIKRHLTHM